MIIGDTPQTATRMITMPSYVYADAERSASTRRWFGARSDTRRLAAPRSLDSSSAISTSCRSRRSPMTRRRFCVCSGERPVACRPMHTAGVSAGNTGEASPAASSFAQHLGRIDGDRPPARAQARDQRGPEQHTGRDQIRRRIGRTEAGDEGGQDP
jgi:hypothetical protein